PVLTHLDKYEQVDLVTQQLCQLLTGVHRDLLDGRAALAEHDLPLALALDEDRLLDAHRAVAAQLPVRRLDSNRVRQLLMQPLENLLPRDLGRELAVGEIRQLIRRVVPGPWRDRADQIGLQVLEPAARECRHHEYPIERDALGQLGGENEEVVLVGKAVDLVQHQQLKAARVPETTENTLDVLVHALHGVDEQHDDIGVESPRPRRLHHRAVEPPARAEDARRIEKDELTGAIDHDAADGD